MTTNIAKLAQGKRPKPAALMRQIVSDIFLPIAGGAEPDFSDYLEVDITAIWDYGPIGYEGTCWRHNTLEFYAAKLDGQEPIFMIIPGFGVDQLKRMLTATNDIENLRRRFSRGRIGSGYAKAKIEFRSSDVCFPLVLEENYERTGLIGRTLAFHLKPDEHLTSEEYDKLYPEK